MRKIIRRAKVFLSLSILVGASLDSSAQFQEGIIAGRYNHNLLLNSDGSVKSWGLNGNAQLGDHSKINRSLPVNVTNLTDVRWLAAGDLHSLAVKEDGTVWGWGSRGNGRLGNGSTTPDYTNAVQITSADLTNITQVGAGAAHSLAMRQDGTVWSWGLNSYGRLGDGTATQRTSPVQVGSPGNFLTGINHIAAGDSHNLAVKSDGTVWAWGNNGSGRIGDGSTIHRTNHVQVGTTGNWLTNVARISAGFSHSLALQSNGVVWAWGDNANGRLGDGTTVDKTLPKQVTNLFNVVSISAGYSHSLALKDDGTVWAWGLNTYGQLGDGTLIQKTNATQVLGLSNVVAIAAGEEHSVAIKEDGSVVAWGHMEFGQLGNGKLEIWPTYQVVGPGFSKIAAGSRHNLAIRDNGTVSWGGNTSGQLGHGTRVNQSMPVSISNLTNVAGLAGGGLHSLAVASNGIVWAWGENGSGRLGDASGTDRLSPVRVGASTNYLENVIEVSGGDSHSVAVKNDGTVWSWGLNSWGRLGDGTATARNIPVQVGTTGNYLSNIVSVAAGEQHTLAVSSNGTIFAWGANAFGKIGDGTTIHRTNYVQVSNASIWVAQKTAIGAGADHSLAIKTNSTVWAWGSNGNGRLGDGTITARSVPTQVTNMTNAIAVAAGLYHSLALKDNGTVWAWGLNTYGQLGDGTTTQRLVPTQVLGLSNVVAIAAGAEHSLALQQDGTLVAWGHTESGQLGIGETGYITTAEPVITTAPFIITEPDSLASLQGAYASFTVIANGQALSYQWKKNGIALADGGNVAGVNTATLSIADLTLADAGDYSVVVSNLQGSDASAIATLTVESVVGPANQAVNAGSTATFSVSISGINTYTYSWKKNGITLVNGGDISGASTATLTVKNVSDEDAGEYTVTVSSGSAIVSSSATLTVDSFAKLGVWRFDTTSYVGEQGQFPTYSNGVVQTSTWSGNGARIPRQTDWSGLRYRTIEANGSANFTPGRGTLRFWFRPNWFSGTSSTPSGPGSHARLFEVGGIGVADGWWYLGMDLQGTRLGLATSLDNQYTEHVGASLNFKSNQWYQIAFTYSSTATHMYINGQLVGSGSGITNVPRQNIMDLGFRIGFDWTGGQSPDGTYDNLETFNYPLSPMEIAREFPNFQEVSHIGDSDYDGRSDFLETEVDGTDPNDADDSAPSLMGYWRFNSTNYWAEQGQIPRNVSNMVSVASWSGDAVQISTTPGTLLRYNDTETNGWANINCRKGTVSFWFNPSWSSQNAGGSGPGTEATFLQLGQYVSYYTEGLWQLGVSANGNAITFETYSNDVVTTYFNHPYSFVQNKWYHIVLTYSPTNTSLYVNGDLEISEYGIQNYPDEVMRSKGILLGTDLGGQHQIQGQLEELQTFNYPLAATNIAASFDGVSEIDSDLNGIADILEDVELAASEPFMSTPFVVTGAIEAEQFDKGGRGIGYWNTYSNSPSDYRVTGMYIEPSNDLGGGYCVSRTAVGDWMKYSFQVQAAGKYTFEARVAADAVGGQFKFEVENANGVANYLTGTLTITDTNWAMLSVSGIDLPAGANSFKVRMIANAADGYIGKFNYISIYPTISENTFPTLTNFVENFGAFYEGDQGTNFWTAHTNSVTAQNAVNNLISNGGGTLAFPPGKYYLAQWYGLTNADPNVNTNYDGWARNSGQNFAINVCGSNVRISGSSEGETILKQHNRSVSLLAIHYAFRFGSGSVPYTNLTVEKITFSGSPHTRLDGSFEPGWFSNGYAYSGVGSFIIAMGGGEHPDLPVTTMRNLFVQNCTFMNTTVPVIIGEVSDACIRSNQFLFYTGEYPDGLATGQPLINDGVTIADGRGWVGVFSGAGTKGVQRIVVTDNYFNGAVSDTNGTRFMTNSSDGIVWFQFGGNYFVSRNEVDKYVLEGVQFNSGPGAVVCNDFDTFQYTASTCAMNLSIGPWTNVVTGTQEDYTFSFIGNQVVGGRHGVMGAYWDTKVSDSKWNLHVGGNDITLSPPMVNAPWGEVFASMIVAANCASMNVSGNLLREGGYGVTASFAHYDADILKNDFGSATQSSVVFNGFAGNLRHVVTAKNVMSLGIGAHIQLNLTDAPKWYLLKNSYLDSLGNPGADLVSLPVDAPVHIKE